MSRFNLGRAAGLALLLLTGAAVAGAQEATAKYDAGLRKIATEYTKRIETATAGLNDARVRIASEKVPLLNDMRAVEDKILNLRAELGSIRINTADFANDRTRREHEANAQKLNISYFAGTASEGLSTLSSTLGNIEMGDWSARVDDLRNRLDPIGGTPDIDAAVETAELMATRVETLLGGFTTPGMAVTSEAHELVQGRFAYFGPETFFVADGADGPAGTVRARDEGAAPLVYALSGWDKADADALVTGRATTLPADVSGGKALQLRQSQGDWIDHINKGGIVGYAILGLGLFALITALLKLLDLNNLSVDAPSATTPLLKHVAETGQPGAEPLLAGLRKTSGELFATGVRNMRKPKEVIEEHLHGFILRERLHHERWLPMLAVIAAASPLLGLLGTVVGMVKTFTLITVFGTGNAGKLSSGISEALVTTELGLTVAIPTLVIHGFLSYRTQKNLSLLERYAVEFVTATEDKRVAESAPDA
ncbi:MotA/TolQ/ExbB proton channel family protein [Synoicihabitans lomoniglobus]|uniref:MotA/TolQ/ExbB proton channel family protein n=1 Tax=Synoicihabitans lomoniglobus TaxID=2909285 RepID=A0AAE9ZVQ3_9BACT|nr:MotA/TolQ/ExbB proton channel family protein [Opitutaceae bacterium LMO-M01]WED64029.1 MotA/TolQ/ExbB proton channel family protein [Opitutaceae bacterium LMO-M01]